MNDEVVLLKHGKATRYQVCDCCGHYAQGLSVRGWCPSCEYECTRIGKLVRERLNQMLVIVGPVPPPIDLAGSTVPESAQIAPGGRVGTGETVPLGNQ